MVLLLFFLNDSFEIHHLKYYFMKLMVFIQSKHFGMHHSKYYF